MSGGEAAAPVVLPVRQARPASTPRPSSLPPSGCSSRFSSGCRSPGLPTTPSPTPTGAPTLANLERLVTDETLRAPLKISLLVATCVGLLSAAVAAPIAWLAARTNMPGRSFVRVLVTASFVTPPFLGAIAWEILAAPNSGLLNQWYRWLYDLPPFVHLLDIYSVTGLIFVDTCYAFPFVFVLVANGLDRTPGDMEDASAILGAKPWRTAWRITLPLALPAVLAGMMVAFLRSLTLFGTPAILALPGNFHTITTKIWSLFQYPPNPGLAAAASIPLLVLTILLLRAERWVLGRRSYAVIGAKNSPPRPVDLKAWRWPALALCLARAVQPGVPALSRARARRAVEDHRRAADARDDDAAACSLRLLRVLADAARAAEHRHPRGRDRDRRHGACARHRLRREPQGHRRPPGARASSRPRRSPCPGIVLGVGLFLAYTRGPVVLYGTLWILFLAYLTIELPAAYQQLQSAFQSLHPELEEAGRLFGAGRMRTLKDILAPLLKTPCSPPGASSSSASCASSPPP